MFLSSAVPCTAKYMSDITVPNALEYGRPTLTPLPDH
jgi:hypothetical protein